MENRLISYDTMNKPSLEDESGLGRKEGKREVAVEAFHSPLFLVFFLLLPFPLFFSDEIAVYPTTSIFSFTTGALGRLLPF